MSDSSMDFAQIAQATDDLRELARGLVAGLQTDGFTDREAHRIATHIMAPPLVEAAPDSAVLMICDGCSSTPMSPSQALAHERGDITVGHEYSLVT